MGMFGFFRKKQEQEEPLQTIEVVMEELPQWFEAAMSEDLREKSKETEQLFKEVVARFSEIRSKLQKLDEARLSGNERMYIAANMIKESFTKKKYVPLNSLVPVYEQFRPDYRYFLQFQEKAMDAIKELKTSTPKQTILLSRYFKRESQDLVDSIKKAEDGSERLGEFLKRGSGSLGLLNRIKGSVEEIQGMLNESQRMESRVSRIRKDIEDSKQRKSELEKGYLNLLKSKDWNEINSLERDVKEARESMREAEMRLNSELSSVKRPLKELEHVLDNYGKLTPIQKNNMRDFVRNPLKTVMNEKGLKGLQKSIGSVIKKTEKMASKEGGEIDLSHLEKSLVRDIPEMRSSYIKLKKHLEKKEKRLEELSKLSGSKEDMEKDIRRASEEAGRLEQDLKDVLSVKSRLAEGVRDKLTELESLILEKAQKKVNIKV